MLQRNKANNIANVTWNKPSVSPPSKVYLHNKYKNMNSTWREKRKWIKENLNINSGLEFCHIFCQMGSFTCSFLLKRELQCSSYTPTHSDGSVDHTAWWHYTQSNQVRQVKKEWALYISTPYSTVFQCIFTSIQRRVEKTVTFPPAQRLLTHTLLPVQPMIQPQREACTLECPHSCSGSRIPEETVIQVDQPPLHSLL